MEDYNYTPSVPSLEELQQQLKEKSSKIEQLEKKIQDLEYSKNGLQARYDSQQRNLYWAKEFIESKVKDGTITDSDDIREANDQLNLGLTQKYQVTLTMSAIVEVEVAYGTEPDEGSFDIEGITYEYAEVDVIESSVDNIDNIEEVED